MARTTSRSKAAPATRPRHRSRRPRKGIRGHRASAAAAPPRQREVQAFLERFSLCLTTGDGDGAVHCFELPALMVMSDAKYGPSQVLQDPQKVSGFFSQALDQYSEKGIATTFPDLLSLDWVDDGLATARVRFPYVDADGNDLGDGEESLYLLRRDENGEYAIVLALALGTDADRMQRRQGRRRGRSKPVGTEGDQLA